MDVLSDVLAVMRTGRPRSAMLTWHAPWAQRFAPVPGAAGFQVVLKGPCWLIRPDVAPVLLAVGDVLFQPHGQGHTLADNPSTPVSAPACDPRAPAVATDTGAATAVAATAVGATAVGATAVGATAVGASGGGSGSGDDTPVTVTLCGAYELEPGATHPLLADLPDLVHLPAHLGRHPELRAAVELLAAELVRPRLGTDALVPALLDSLLLYLLRTWFDEQVAAGASTGWAAALGDPATGSALRAMHADPARPWTVATLAAEAGLSRAPFARRFAALLGQPPLTYLTWWRMTLAARLLRESDVPLSVVAARVGYGSEYAFGNAFKRRYGTAPGRYRRATPRVGPAEEDLSPASR